MRFYVAPVEFVPKTYIFVGAFGNLWIWKRGYRGTTYIFAHHCSNGFYLVTKRHC